MTRHQHTHTLRPGDGHLLLQEAAAMFHFSHDEPDSQQFIVLSHCGTLLQGLTRSRKVFEEKMASEGLEVKAQVFAERKISNESMRDQAELMLYGNWRRHMWLTISAGVTTLLIGLATVLNSRRQQLYCWWYGTKLKDFDDLSRTSSKGMLSHSSLESFARSNSGSTPASLRRLKGASNWSELSRYAGLLQLDVHTGSRIERTDLHICSKEGVPWVLGSGAYGIVYKAIRNGVQEVAIKILAAADDQQLHAFKKVSCLDCHCTGRPGNTQPAVWLLAGMQFHPQTTYLVDDCLRDYQKGITLSRLVS